jgi:hypothetical protein
VLIATMRVNREMTMEGDGRNLRIETLLALFDMFVPPSS